MKRAAALGCGTAAALAFVLMFMPPVRAVDGPGAGDVTTLAGSGVLGIEDGPAAQARFLAPVALAHGADGTLYVVDEAAERIRAIRDGFVSTVAGSGAPIAPGFAVAGGYRDGPALEAQFDHPSGIAVAKDGSLYVADAKNAVIRRIAHGMVTTVAGIAGDPGTRDGDARTGRLIDPRALAFAPDGTLWIADDGAGLRRWRDGMLSTITLSSDPRDDGVARETLAVAVQPDDGTLVIATPAGLSSYSPRARLGGIESTTYDYTEAGIAVGPATNLVALGRHQVLFSDTATDQVRYLRFAAAPFLTTSYVAVIAGGRSERAEDNAGDADGDAVAARFDGPRGLDVSGSRVAVADTGNRRVRGFALPAFRPPEGGELSRYVYDTKHYEVALVGASYDDYDSAGPDSICAAVERELDASGRLSKPARCHAVRADAATIPSQESYVEANLTLRPVDAVVLMSFPRKVDDFPGTTRAERIAAFGASLVALRSAFGPKPPELAIFWRYYFFDVSDTEALWEREDAHVDAPFPYRPEQIGPADAHAVFGAAAQAGFAQCDAFDALLAYERGASLPLFLNGDEHPNVRGNAFLGRLLGAFLAQRSNAR